MSPSSTISPQERVARIMNSMDAPHVCEHCGGSHFAAVEFRQYAVGHYASSPGGDLHAIGGMPQVIMVCICGWPKSPNIGGIRGGRTASGEVASFLDSLRKAQAFLAKDPLDDFRGAVGPIVHEAVTQATSELALKAEVEAVSAGQKTANLEFLEEIQALGEKLEQLTQTVTAPAAPAGPPVAHAELAAKRSPATGRKDEPRS